MSEAARKGIGRRLYEGWLVIAGHFGEVQTTVILFLSYVFAIGPVALVMQRKDLLDKKRLRDSPSAWKDADTAGADLERAKRLF
jgi:hypothetical protein